MGALICCMKKLALLLCLLCFSTGAWAFDSNRVETLLAGNNIAGAKRVLLEEYQKSNDKDEREQIQFILAQLSLKQGKPEEAIAIYRHMLAKNPALSRVRLELGYLYFMQKEDDAARYHLRLVLTEKDLQPQVRQQIKSMLEAIRRRRAWQLYVSVGMAPDSNVNTMSGRRLECFTVMGFPFCRELDSIESDVGFQGFASLSYIQKLTDNWSIKGRLMLDAIDYSDDKYSFWGIGGELGPRYVSGKSEYGLGVSYRQQWNDEHRYSHTKGIFGESSVDISNRLSHYTRLAFDKVEYNDFQYQGYNADNYGVFTRLTYGISNRSYAVLSASLMYEHSETDWNSNIRQRYGVGYGRELPWGFNIYAEPNITLTSYRKERYFIGRNWSLEEIKRSDTTYGVYASLSNKHLRFGDITPTINFIYNKRLSNVYNYDYDRTRWEIGLSKSF